MRFFIHNYYKLLSFSTKLVIHQVSAVLHRIVMQTHHMYHPNIAFHNVPMVQTSPSKLFFICTRREITMQALHLFVLIMHGITSHIRCTHHSNIVFYMLIHFKVYHSMSLHTYKVQNFTYLLSSLLACIHA